MWVEYNQQANKFGFIKNWYNRYHFGLNYGASLTFDEIVGTRYFLFDGHASAWSESSDYAGKGSSNRCESPYTAYNSLNPYSYLTYLNLTKVEFLDSTKRINFVRKSAVDGRTPNTEFDIYIKFCWEDTEWPGQLKNYGPDRDYQNRNLVSSGQLSTKTDIDIGGVGCDGFWDFYCNFVGGVESAYDSQPFHIYFKELLVGNSTYGSTCMLVCMKNTAINSNTVVSNNQRQYVPGNIVGTSDYGGGECIWCFYNGIPPEYTIYF